MKIKVLITGKETVIKEYSEPVCIREIADEMQKTHPYRIVLARFERHIRRLDEKIARSGHLELLDMRDPSGKMCYQASLTLLFDRAIHDVAGEEVKIRVNNALSKGLFTTLKGCTLEDETIAAINRRMRELVEARIPIRKEAADRDRLIEELRVHDREDLVENLEVTPDLELASLYMLGESIWSFADELVPDTGYIDIFDVVRYKYGLLIRFPSPSDPSSIPPLTEQKLIYDAFSEQNKWNKVTNIRMASDLNRVILHEKYKDLILLCEALHEKKIAAIAEWIAQEKKRIILIAGPSSSGKTTFANRLCIQLRTTGLKPLYIGTDDYFLDRIHTPIGEDGKPDFEGLAALDRELLNKDLNQLLEGEETDIPSYNFKEGKKEFGKRITKITSAQPIVIEGLHCLNPELTAHIPDEDKFRIYISPLTQLNIDEHNRVPATDARMLRRIVRDAQFRGYSAASTIDIWPKVNRGEDTNIFPFSIHADTYFNSSSVYELAVLKKYAKPQLERITDRQPEYAEAQRLLKLLKYFVTIEDDELVPNNSILREFIGGSVIV